VAAVNSSGTVTIQAPASLNIIAGGNLNMSGSTVDVKAGLSGIHGPSKPTRSLPPLSSHNPTDPAPEPFGTDYVQSDSAVMEKDTTLGVPSLRFSRILLSLSHPKHGGKRHNTGTNLTLHLFKLTRTYNPGNRY